MPQLVDNPIINSYLQGLQMRRQQEAQQFEQQQKTEEGARQQEQLKGYLAHLKAQEEHQAAGIEMQKAQLKQQKMSHVFEATKYLADQQQRGLYDPNAVVPDQTQVGGQIQTTQTPGGMGPTYGVANLPTTQQNVQPTLSTMPSPQPEQVEIAPGVMMNPAGIKNQEDIFARSLQQFQQKAPVEAAAKAAETGLITSAKENVLQPGRITLQTQKDEAAKKLQEERAASALAVANINGANRMAYGNLMNSGRLAAARIGKAVDPVSVTNNAMLHATGQGGVPFGNNDDDRAGKLALSHAGYVDFDPKDAKLLREMKSLDPLYDKMEQIIQNLPEDKVNAAGQRILAAIPGSDLKNLKDELISASGHIARTRGSERGALATKDIERQINALGAPGKTKAQALSNFKFLRAYSSNRITDQILGGMSDKQKILNFTTHKFDPAIAGGYIKRPNGEYTQRYSQDPENPDQWGVYNLKTDSYEKVK